jgi:hypothetical protein
VCCQMESRKSRWGRYQHWILHFHFILGQWIWHIDEEC